MKQLASFLVVLSLLLGILPPQTTSAATAQEWRAGNIISDNIFSYGEDMSVQDIQNFLNAEVPKCDTNGTITSEYGGGTRSQWAVSRGYPGQFTCLRDYYEVPKTDPGDWLPANNYGGKPIPSGAISAAQMIANAAQKYKINPKVLLVKLHTESAGPLTTDEWPLEKQYTYAMGAHCPDSGPGGAANCDPRYSGFSIQMYQAASLLRWYLDSMNQSWWSYKKPYSSNHILWNVEPRGCGGSNVYIESKATAALYTYTPYQPNQAALNNMYGTGDYCSAYGNRNFWRVYTDWFGRPTSIPIEGCHPATGTALACVWKAENNQTDEEIITTSYSEINDVVNRLGYSYLGVDFLAKSPAAPGPGNIPVYALGPSKGRTFITTNPTEYNALKASGWTDQGIMFYADPAGSNSGYDVHRLYNPTSGRHVWTSVWSEVERYKDNGYKYEGLAFMSMSPFEQSKAPPTGKDNVYRFYIPQTAAHFWTVNLGERDNLLRNGGYVYEGVAWYSDKSKQGLPVYRLYSTNVKKHLYTADSNEKNVLTSSGKWIDEGIAYYVSNTPNPNPVYRLYAPSLTKHHLTADANERMSLLNSGKWINEHIAWYQY